MPARSGTLLTVDIQPRLDVLNAEEWQRLFCGFPDSLEMIRHIQQVGIPGFIFHSLVVRQGQKPLLMIPLFETRYALHSAYQGLGRMILDGLAKLLPKLLTPTMLGLGFIEGEWGQVGYDPAASFDLLKQAWQLAIPALESLAQARGAQLITLVNFTEAGAAIIPPEFCAGFARMQTNPCGVLPIHYRNLDDYLNHLSKATRKDLRRKMKKNPLLKIIRTTDPGACLNQIYAFYTHTVEQSDLSFGMQPKAYFKEVCKNVPGAEYTLYYYENHLVAFNLLVLSGDCLIDKYFAMDPVMGRQLNLYFLSWLENIRYCIEHQISRYHAGPAAEKLKARLGAEFIAETVAFKHCNPLAQKVLLMIKSLAERFSTEGGYESELDLPPVRLGAYWLTEEEHPEQSEAAALIPQVFPVEAISHG